MCSIKHEIQFIRFKVNEILKSKNSNKTNKSTKGNETQEKNKETKAQQKQSITLR